MVYKLLSRNCSALIVDIMGIGRCAYRARAKLVPFDSEYSADVTGISLCTRE